MAPLQHDLSRTTLAPESTTTSTIAPRKNLLSGADSPTVDRSAVLDEMYEARMRTTVQQGAALTAVSEPRPAPVVEPEAPAPEESRGWFSRLWGGVVGTVRGVGRLARDAATFAYDMATNPEKRAAVAQSIVDGVSSAARAVGGALKSAAQYVYAIATDPEKRAELLNSIKEVAKAGWELATNPDTYINAARAVGKALYTLATDPKAALQAAWTGIKFASEIIGITDVLLTFKHAGLGLIEYGNGNDKAALGHFAKAAMHGTFAAMSIGSIAATVATAGAAGGSIVAVAAGRMALREGAELVLKVAAREFLEAGAQQVGKEIVGELTQSVGREALERTLAAGARDVVDSGVHQLAERVSREGAAALTEQSMQEVMRDSAAQVTERMLRELNVAERVSDKTLVLLQEMQGKSLSELTEILRAQGIADPKKAAREFQRALRNGTADELLKQTLEDGISRELTAMVEGGMEREFRMRLRQSLAGELSDASSQTLARAVHEQAQELAERTGRSLAECQRQLVDNYVEAGWRGAREGIEAGVRSVVREGIDDAFERFRRRRHDNRPAGGAAVAAVSARNGSGVEEAPAGASTSSQEDELQTKKSEEGAARRLGPTITYETQGEVGADGALIERTYRVNHITGRRELISERADALIHEPGGRAPRDHRRIAVRGQERTGAENE